MSYLGNETSPQLLTNDDVDPAFDINSGGGGAGGSGTIEPGGICYYARTTAPAGWLVADGSAISRATYPLLFAAIGTLWGPGDGSTTFNLPNLLGVFPRGIDNGRGLDPNRAMGGLNAYQDDTFKSHTHGVGYRAFNASINDQSKWSLHASDAYKQTQATGGTETRPKNVALLPCIKY